MSKVVSDVVALYTKEAINTYGGTKTVHLTLIVKRLPNTSRSFSVCCDLQWWLYYIYTAEFHCKKRI